MESGCAIYGGLLTLQATSVGYKCWPQGMLNGYDAWSMVDCEDELY